MNLLAALEILKRPVSEGASGRDIFLACGFTPLHLKTFLAAHLWPAGSRQGSAAPFPREGGGMIPPRWVGTHLQSSEWPTFTPTEKSCD